ncbi:aminotransferase class III-fold pyridoxal phosphate-dependent enzyme [Paracoccaceae bacterium]|nr:aminotransferase class III-fold pyridoxal phosphate-dependent enzyme [Paracoccaceae bacterium]
MNSGIKLWNKAKKIIPGGNMLLSKRSEMFLPNYWPSYYSKAKGCYVWDLDGNKYLDMSIMGIGTNTLGYSHPEVDEQVLKAVQSGNMSTFNCSEEVQLAEKLVEIHPWSKMVRFARSGGEANAIAIRIARAASGKEKVAICGYHGWHDWYLAANVNDEDALQGHLLPGLDPTGVPKALKDTTFTFRYNDFEGLLRLVQEHDIGVVKMEVVRNSGPTNDFLKKVRRLCNDKNIVLVFDECTSGFRENFGGIHKNYEVEPDMCVFGKALGNGYALTAVIGKDEVMSYAQNTFISSTFWTEKIGPTAALATLNVMERDSTWEITSQVGLKLQKGWLDLAASHSLDISINGIPSISSFNINSHHNLIYKTYITQEMLKKGILASNLIFTCIDHDDGVLSPYFTELDTIFQKIQFCEAGNLCPSELLDGEVCHDGFKRLN